MLHVAAVDYGSVIVSNKMESMRYGIQPGADSNITQENHTVPR